MDYNLGVVVHTCSPSSWKDEAGGPKLWGQPGLRNKTLFQKTSKQTKNRVLRILLFFMNL
jgi:hypothetical protein